MIEIPLRNRKREIVAAAAVRHDLGFFVSEEEAARAASEFRAQHMPFAVEV